MEKIRLLVAEDETIIRMALIKLLESYSGYCVVGEAENGHELMEKYPKAKPDIVLCDLTMPIMNGLESSAKILKQDRFAKIILFTMHNEEEYICGAIRLGILGYVTKYLLDSDLRFAIQSVYEGGTYYLGKTIEEIEEIKSRCCNKGMDGKFDELSTREKEVLFWVAAGMTSDEVSIKLNISKRTVDCHRFSIKEKTGLNKRSEIVDLLKNIKQFPRVN
ncbi:MAG: response regulator transcription factor [Ignavibacteriales bacterium]|nr:response regulator transcription factor [Ignavibacteriales bacterium]